MKKNLFTIVLLCFISISYGQITLDYDSVHEEYQDNDVEFTVHNMHSVADAPKAIKWSLYSVNVPSDWVNDVFVCDALQCWDETTDENAYEVPDEKKYPLDVHFLNNDLTGEGAAEILIWEEEDSLNTFKIVKYTVRITEFVETSIKNISESNVKVYPNPVLNQLYINDLATNTLSRIELFNVIGKKMLTIDNPQELESINMESFSKGIYILKITDLHQKNYSQNIIKL